MGKRVPIARKGRDAQHTVKGVAGERWSEGSTPIHIHDSGIRRLNRRTTPQTTETTQRGRPERSSERTIASRCVFNIVSRRGRSTRQFAATDNIHLPGPVEATTRFPHRSHVDRILFDIPCASPSEHLRNRCAVTEHAHATVPYERNILMHSFGKRIEHAVRDGIRCEDEQDKE